MRNDFLLEYSAGLPEPENLFAGKRLPDNFTLPDNILVFYHDFTAAMPNSHGRCTIVLPLDKMTYFVDRNRFELEPGVVLFVPPYAVRFLYPDSKGYRRLFITFDSPGSQNYIPEAGQYRTDEKTKTLLNSFLKSYKENKTEFSSMELVRFLYMIRPAQLKTEASRPLPQAVERTVEYIEQNFERQPRIKEIAAFIGLSQSFLRALFHKEMGISLGQYLIRKRFEYAKYQLIHSGMSLKEIAKKCGCPNEYVFNSFFKKRSGIPPLRYRRRYGTRSAR